MLNPMKVLKKKRRLRVYFLRQTDLANKMFQKRLTFRLFVFVYCKLKCMFKNGLRKENERNSLSLFLLCHKLYYCHTMNKTMEPVAMNALYYNQRYIQRLLMKKESRSQ